MLMRGQLADFLSLALAPRRAGYKLFLFTFFSRNYGMHRMLVHICCQVGHREYGFVRIEKYSRQTADFCSHRLCYPRAQRNERTLTRSPMERRVG